MGEAQEGVKKGITRPYSYGTSLHIIARLPEMKKKLAEMEKRLNEIETSLNPTET